MDILSATLEEILQAFKKNSIPDFRAKQVYEWFHKHLVLDYDEMTNLPKSMREQLKDEFPVISCYLAKKQVSADGTVKYLFALEDEDYIESVVMKYRHGNTICVSTQVGCKMGCAFCASTIGGFKRNLTAGEILSQVYLATKELGERIGNIVLMGMGEPLDNFDNVMRFISLVTDEKGQNISMRNISLSTCGLVDKIETLLSKRLQLTLSVSLHAPNDEIRNKIMPINKRYNIQELLDICRKYTKETSRRISFEYSMLKDINDSDECAKELATRLKGMLCHVNLIPVNQVEESPFKPSTPERVKNFAKILESHGITTTVRRKLGSDIGASCGQLRLKQNKKGETQYDSCC